MSVHRKPDGRWFCKWYEDGKERRQYFGRGDIARQQAIHADDQKKRDSGRIKQDAGLSISELCQAYHLQHLVRSSTAKSDAYRLVSVILPALGDLPANLITSHQLNDYCLERLRAGKKRRTVDREIDVLRSAFNWAARQEPPLIVRNPLAAYRVPGRDDDDVPMPPTVQEIQAILRHAPDHLVRAITIEWYCGLRPGGEVSRITWQDVDLDGRQIRIESARKGGPPCRYVPVSDSLAERLVAWQASDRASHEAIANLPLVHYRGKPVLSLKRSWASAKKKAGLTRRLRLYDIRHAMASMALRGGADLKAVSEILGHSRPDTTLIIYQHVLRDQHREAAEKIPDLSFLKSV